MVLPFGKVRRVWRGPLRGAHFVVAPGMGFSYALGAYGGGMAFLAENVSPGMTVFDVGGNRGQMALFFGRLVGSSGVVYCFEAVKELCEMVRRNARLNDMGNIEAHCLAVSDANGHAAFLFSEALSTQGKLEEVEQSYQYAGAHRIEVETRTLDDFCSQEGVYPDLIKIDVEGAGAAVLRGAQGVLDNYSPKVFIELHGPEEQQGVKDFLQARGYTLQTLDGSRVEDPTVGWHGTLWCHKESAHT